MPSELTMTRTQALEFFDSFGPWPTSVLATTEPPRASLRGEGVDLRAYGRAVVRATVARFDGVFGQPLGHPGMCVAAMPDEAGVSGVPTLREDFVTDTEVL